MAPAFAGFSDDFFAFFAELAASNTREWFEANKPRYKDVVQGELAAFVTAVAPRLERISRHYLADPRPNGKTIFRIYRDVRFSRDKRPYKEHAACHFRHSGEGDVHGPGYYVHLEPKEVIFGGGIWKPAPVIIWCSDVIRWPSCQAMWFASGTERTKSSASVRSLI